MPRPGRPKLVQTIPRKPRAVEQPTEPVGEAATHLSQPSATLESNKGWKGTSTKIKGRGKNSLLSRPDESAGPSERALEPDQDERSKRNPQASVRARSDAGGDTTRRSDGDDQSTTASHIQAEAISRRGAHARYDPQTSSVSSAASRPLNTLGARHSIRSKLQGTPLAQSSMLGALHFKKRARQPSLLQHSRQTSPENLYDMDVQDFEPDDESTPLIKASGATAINVSPPQSSGSRKRKLATPEVQVERSQSLLRQMPSPSNASPASTESFILPPDAEVEVQAPTLPRRVSRRTPSPNIFSDTLAPPESSSSPVQASQRAAKARKTEQSAGARQRTKRDVQGAQIAQKTPPRQKLRALPLTTAHLQNLLPQRREQLRHRSTYDVLSSSDVELDVTKLGEDEDELSFQASTKLRRQKGAILPPKKRNPIKTDMNVTKKKTKVKRPSTTYSRKQGAESPDESDEIDFDGDTSLDIDDSTGKVMPIMDSKTKAEMSRVANKFKEIDDFDLDFEDMTGGSSQMKDAR